jgi:hypothetical protein
VSRFSVPLGDARQLRSRARSVRLARYALLAAVVCLVVLAFVRALGLRPERTSPLPESASGVVVLDISASISSDTYARIRATLNRLIRSRGAYGLVVFSDTAYLALPPGTPARELAPFARFFDVRVRERPGALPQLPKSPWSESFSAGTRISTGLELALQVIREQRLVDPAVLLVSDLDDDTGDLPRVSRIAIAYRRAGIPLHVVGLNPAPDDAAFVRRLVPANGSFTRAPLSAQGEQGVSGRFDTGLGVTVVVIALALAALLVLVVRPRWRIA